ncbi:hypothetical protein Pcinc_038863 [Petrolisthes cinctipes]|uniref:Sulfotransferase domain-containing protein n=1 Tax=Petrolisthes cinctipes TaxID=88211 RepID=A0AAE1BST8_PETCI|nr:hypothetical protein Pcinc_038863 [Petrolisthes cinctipes]
MLLNTLHASVHRPPEDTLKEDPERPTWQLWEDDPACSHYHTRFGKGLTPVQLVSVPCSGSTWLRYLLEASTGFFTGLLGEKDGVMGNTLLQRTHGPALLTNIHDLQGRYKHIDPDLPTILLIRDPGRTLISYWKLFNLEGFNKHLMDIPEWRFEDGDFHIFLTQIISLFEELIVDRLLWNTGPLYIIHYEDLKKDTFTHLRHLLNFLDFPVDEGRMACLKAHTKGPFRRKNYNIAYNPYNASEKVMFANVVNRINRLLLLLGYPTMPPDDRQW